MNGIRAAGGNAGPAVDASIRIHIKLGRSFKSNFILLGMNAVRRASVDAKKVFDAGVGNYIGHVNPRKWLVNTTLSQPKQEGVELTVMTVTIRQGGEVTRTCDHYHSGVDDFKVERVQQRRMY